MKTSDVIAALAALAQETRLGVYRALVEHAPEGLTAGDIAQRVGVPPATLSFHLKELARAGLIDSRQAGRFIWYRANIDAMNGLVAYLTENCCGSSGVCDPACVPAGAPRAVAVPLPAVRKRRSV
jgi:ArsR family transcriptional regulator, arsenate/arsenite/antimonite-responsive transcriptional repressor